MSRSAAFWRGVEIPFVPLSPRDLRNVWLAVDVLTSVGLLEALFELVLEVFGAPLCAFVIQLASSGMLKLFRAARDLTFFN